MDQLIAFLKKTWLLLVILFSPPVLVVALFAYKEYICGTINMTAGEWSSVFTGTFGYWGTVILGVLAFWQNQQVQQNNDILMRYEQSRMAPIFSVENHSFSGLSNMQLSITNITDNIACSFSLGPMKVTRPDGTSSEHAVSSTIKDYLNAHETITAIFETPAIIIGDDEEYRFSFNMKSTDIVGNKKITAVNIRVKKDMLLKIEYSIIVV